MASGQPQSTLRELQTHLGAPRVLAVQAGVALVLGLSGPFGTFQTLGPALRLLYWAAVVFGTYAIGAAMTLMVVERLPIRHGITGRALRVVAGGAVIGVAVLAYLAVLGLVMHGRDAGLSAAGPTSLIGAFSVSWVVLTLREVMLHEQSPASPATVGDAPAILRRLPLDKRGALVSLSAEDHYVAVATTRGRELVLMRLADAIDQAAGVPGLQVHRSHWVALDQIQAARRQGEGAVLVLAGGREVPVSRSRMAAVREAGLLAQ